MPSFKWGKFKWEFLQTVAEQRGNNPRDYKKSMHKFHPYKMLVLQEIYENNYDKRVQFCDTISDQIIAIPNLLTNICLSN